LQKENNFRGDGALSNWLFLWYDSSLFILKNNWMINDSLKVCHTGSVNYIETERGWRKKSCFWVYRSCKICNSVRLC
jgi:hypothetical protein